MATRSAAILVDRETGKAESIYIHWDGYPEGVGRTLVEYYNAPNRVKKLISLGDISVLAPFLDPEEVKRVTGYKCKVHTFDKSCPATVVAYGRDRGEENIDAEKWTFSPPPKGDKSLRKWIKDAVKTILENTHVLGGSEYLYFGFPEDGRVHWYVYDRYSGAVYDLEKKYLPLPNWEKYAKKEFFEELERKKVLGYL